MMDYLGWGSILFVGILTALLHVENSAQMALYGILSSPYLASLGNSIDAGFQFIDFDGLISTVAPNASQPQLILFILFFVIPGCVAAIGARNLLFLTEIWGTHVCIQLLAQWG